MTHHRDQVRKRINDSLRGMADISLDSPNGFTYLNEQARQVAREAADIIEHLEDQLKLAHETLEFYAESTSGGWAPDDGDRARDTLEKMEALINAK